MKKYIFLKILCLFVMTAIFASVAITCSNASNFGKIASANRAIDMQTARVNQEVGIMSIQDTLRFDGILDGGAKYGHISDADLTWSIKLMQDKKGIHTDYPWQGNRWL